MRVERDVPKALFQRIEQAARTTSQPTKTYMREAIEAQVASHRLQTLPPSDLTAHRDRRPSASLSARGTGVSPMPSFNLHL